MIAETLLITSVAGMIYADYRKRAQHLVARSAISLHDSMQEAKAEAEETKKIELDELLKHVKNTGLAVYQAAKLDQAITPGDSKTLLDIIMKKVPDSVLTFKDANGRMPTVEDYPVVSVDDLVFIEALSKCLGTQKARPKSRQPSLSPA